MINISAQIYSVCNNVKSADSIAEVTLLPIDNTTASKNKRDKLSNTTAIVTVHENIPLPGFTLYDAGKKNWSSTDSTWLVIDPRGFLCRITTPNLCNILKITGITEGLIQEKCVWARENSQSQLVLLPISDTSYEDAIKNTTLIKEKVSISDVNIGDTVLLQSGMTGRYMGVLSLYGPVTSPRLNTFSVQTYIRRQIVECAPGRYFYQTDTKILKVVDKAEVSMTKEESANIINQTINAGTSYFTSNDFNNNCLTGQYYGMWGKIMHVSPAAVPHVPISIEEINEQEAEDLLSCISTRGDDGTMIVECSKSDRYLISPQTSTSFEITKIVSISDTSIICAKPDNYHKKPLYELVKFSKFYKVVKHIKKEMYV